MLFLIVFKNNCQKYEGVKAPTLTCWQHHWFGKVHIKVCGRAYISIAAGLKSCFYSKHELYCRYFTIIFLNDFRICEYESVMDSFFSEVEIV